MRFYLSTPINSTVSPFTAPENNSGAAKMRLYLRNGLYVLVFFLLTTAFKTALHLSNAKFQSEKDLEGLTTEFVAHPERQRRAILDYKSNYDYKSHLSFFDQIREGPIVDLGNSVPATFGTDIFISVKTTAKYHASRLKDIADTWFRLAPENVFFFSDDKDQATTHMTGGHLIDTNCSGSHSRQALCCKMGVEFDFFIRSGRRWFCHFDDDNYVNVPELMRLLGSFDPGKDWYLGRPSTRGPIEILDRDHLPRISFWFATGGAGFCVSRSLAMKMQPYVGKRKFMELGERIRLPDDVTVGFLIEHLLDRRLTVVDRFHSHLESMKMIPVNTLHLQVSLSGGSYSSQKNVVGVEGGWREEEDPNRFRALHCFLFPHAHICPPPTTS